MHSLVWWFFFFFFQAEDGIRDVAVTGVQTCALPILSRLSRATVRSGGRGSRSTLWFGCATVPDTRCCCRPARRGSIGPTRRRVAFVVCHAHRSRGASRCPTGSHRYLLPLSARSGLAHGALDSSYPPGPTQLPEHRSRRSSPSCRPPDPRCPDLHNPRL